jgi:hypothetical protein
MNFQNWLAANHKENLMDMSDSEKDQAVILFIQDEANTKTVSQAINEHLLQDAALQGLLMLSDEDCGRLLKNAMYAMLEADIVDAMERYTDNEPKSVQFYYVPSYFGHRASDF